MSLDAHNLTLRQLRAFRMVARTRSFVAASRELFITPSALSDTIRQLEEVLGTRLFDRTTRRVDLTEAGSLFLADVSEGLGLIDAAARRMNHLGSAKTGRVTVVGPGSIHARITAPCVAELMSTHPGIHFSLTEDGTSAIVASVMDGQSSFGVGVMPGDATDALEAEPLISDLYGVIARSGHEIFTLKTMPPEAVYTWNYISFTNSSIATDVFYAQTAPRIEVNGFGTMVYFLERGAGVSILPALAAQDFTSDKLEFRPFSNPSFERRVSLIRARDRSLSPAAALLWSKMKERAKGFTAE